MSSDHNSVRCSCICVCRRWILDNEFKRNRSQTSPTGSTPYSELKKSAPDTTWKYQHDHVVRDHPSARKALFQQSAKWTKGEEKLLVLFVALHCLDLDSAWPKYSSGHSLWEEASEFLSLQSSGMFYRSGMVYFIEMFRCTLLKCFGATYDVFCLAYSCRSRIINHLSQRFTSVSEAEVHYGIDLEGSEDDVSFESVIASPIQRQAAPKSVAKKSRTSTGVQTESDVVIRASTTTQTTTAVTQTESLETQLLTFLRSQPLSSQVCSTDVMAYFNLSIVIVIVI